MALPQPQLDPTGQRPPLFEWVTPWPGQGTFVHFALLGVLSLLITLGLCYRVSMALFFAFDPQTQASTSPSSSISRQIQKMSS